MEDISRTTHDYQKRKKEIEIAWSVLCRVSSIKRYVHRETCRQCKYSHMIMSRIKWKGFWATSTNSSFIHQNKIKERKIHIKNEEQERKRERKTHQYFHMSCPDSQKLHQQGDKETESNFFITTSFKCRTII